MSAQAQNPDRARETWRTIALAALLAAVLAWLALQAHGAEDAAPLELPPLPEVSAGCAVSVDAAPSRARDAEAAADAKLLRYPFEAGEGLRALQLLAEAESCYRHARRPDAARRVAATAERRREQLARAYRAHRLRLQRALETDEDAAALRELRVLGALLRPAGQSAALRSLRRLELELEGATPRENDR